MDRITVLQAAGIGLVLSISILGIAFGLSVRSADTRNSSLRGLIAGFSKSRLRHGSLFLIGAGIISIVSSFVLQLIIRPEGVIESEDVYTLRMPHNLEVASLSNATQVAVGEALATFRSPQFEAEYKALELHSKELEAKREVLAAKPLEADPRLVQREQELEAEYRHLRETIERFTLEQREVSRQKVRDIQHKKLRIIELDGTLSELPQELLQRQTELATKTKELQRLEQLRATNAVPEQENDVIEAKVAVLNAETKKLQSKLATVQQELAQCKQDLSELASLMEQQTSESDQELQNLREQLATIVKQRAELNDDLGQDLSAAKQRRKAEIKQLGLELEQTIKKITGLRKTLIVTAPLSGQVAYRNPSPGTAHTDDPLVVIAPSGAFRFRARLPRAQANALKKQDSVPLELRRVLRTTTDDVELPPQQLVRRFSGRPLHFETLKDDPAVVLVELSCQPPEEAVRALVLGETVRAELAWTPPFYTLALFVLGSVSLALGVGGMLIIRRQHGNEPVTKEISFDPAPANASLRQSTPDAVALRLLGEQLAEMILDEQLDPSLLATVEWALDRHGLEGVRHLGQGIRDCGPISNEFNRLIDHAARNGSSYGCALFRRQQLSERLISLLRVIAPEEVAEPDQSGVERLAV